VGVGLFSQVTSGRMRGKISSLKVLSSTGTSCPGKWLSNHPWRSLKDPYRWHLGTWFSGGLGSVTLMAGFDLKGLFQLHDSMIKKGHIHLPRVTNKSAVWS